MVQQLSLPLLLSPLDALGPFTVDLDMYMYMYDTLTETVRRLPHPFFKGNGRQMSHKI
jgi:hypothetical protein